MIKARVLTSLLMLILLLFYSCSDDNTPTISTPSTPTGETSNDTTTYALYVKAGCNGDGSIGSPLGNIQEAVNLAYSDSNIVCIYIASGEYYESVVINCGISMHGSRYIDHLWNLPSSDSTIIYGQTIDGYNIGIVINDIEEHVFLSDLAIVSKDAVEPGGSSYGVYCKDAENVDIQNCRVVAGKGIDGISGADGESGEDGESGGMWWYGQYPVAGGKGGSGGSCDGERVVTDGDSGSSYLNSPPGGAGGKHYTLGEGDDGEDGGDGLNGSDGSGSAPGLIPKYEGDWILACADDGEDGTNGCYGSGGGGGGGVSVSYGNNGCYAGSSGSGGGAGASPGLAGLGGHAGGSSIAILSFRSNIAISGCTLCAGNAGNGGNGGTAGSGGRGGTGGPSDCLSWCAGAGGVGGDGGDGGHGGGGGGGSSVCLVIYESSVDLQNNNAWQVGAAGEGGTGGSETNGGGDGLSQGVVFILTEPSADQSNSVAVNQ